MANKEIYRTISKPWLLNYCIVIVIITLHLSYALDITLDNTGAALQNATSIENNLTSQNPVAEPLIRYRRQPPRTIVKHVIRPKRYKMKRVKRPKIKYSFAEPPPTYYSRKPVIIKKPTFDSSLFEDFSHMNVESADFDLPPSSYEAQSMDLDLYKHYEPSIEAASYSEVHKPTVYTYMEPEISYKEPPYTEVSKSPSYTHSGPEIRFKGTSKPSVTYSYKVASQRKPHTSYGVPTELVYSTGYDKPSDNKYTFEAPASRPFYTEVEKPYYGNGHIKNEYSYSKPAKEVLRIPATTYGVPEVHIPATGSNDYNKYSVVEQKPPYASHASTKTKSYHFAEPPQPEPSVEITYSPSYEINIPAPHENSYSYVENHAAAQHPPPQQQPPPQLHPPPQPANYQESSYQEHPKYDDVPQQYDVPENSYDSPPQENYEDISHSQQEVSGTNQPASYQPAPPKHQNIDEYIPTSQELPININHKQPPYDYPKSSYEVPIYDPIPFDASNQQEREIYPPQTFDQTIRHQPATTTNNPTEQRPTSEESTPNTKHTADEGPQANVKRPQSPINRLRGNLKRKRTKGSSTTISTTKHILDVPELEEAFEKENRNKFSHSEEPDAHESQRFEHINNQNNINDNYSKGFWNPMKIRTSPIMQMTAITGSTNTPSITKNKRYHHKQQRTTTTTSTTTTTEVPAKVENISIEKSRSKAYYDGVVVPTSKIYNTNFFRNRFRLENGYTSTTTQPHLKSTNENQFSKRTTKNVFDTTIFKSPINDKDVYRNMPKNHKII